MKALLFTLLALIIIFSCDTKADINDEKKVDIKKALAHAIANNQEVFECNSKLTFDTSRQTQYFPKGEIPQWVKDSLPEDKLNLLKQLSEKYEISYDKHPDKSLKTQILNNDLTIDILLDNDFIIESPTINSDTSESIKNLSARIIDDKYMTVQHECLKNIVSAKYAKIYTVFLYGHYSYTYELTDNGPHTSRIIDSLPDRDTIKYRLKDFYKYTQTLRTAGLTISQIEWEDEGSFTTVMSDLQHFKTYCSGRVMTRVTLENIGANICLGDIYETFIIPLRPTQS